MSVYFLVLKDVKYLHILVFSILFNLSHTDAFLPHTCSKVNNGSTFTFEEPQFFSYDHVNVIIGDFNSHSTSWGYEETNENGNLVEDWAEAHHLDLIHDAKLPPSFNSCR